MAMKAIAVTDQMSRSTCPTDYQEILHASEHEGFPDNDYMDSSRKVFASLQGMLLLLGIFINSLICYVMIRRQKIHRSTANFYLFHLSTTELLLWIVVLPVAMVIQMSDADSRVPCKILVFVIFTCEAVMFGLLTAIAIDKYTNIISPLKGLVLEERKFMSVAILWVFALVISAPFLYSVEEAILKYDLTTSTLIRITGNNKEEFQSIRNGTVTGGNVTFNQTTYRNTSCILPMRICEIPSNARGQATCTFYFIVSFLLPLILIIFAYSKIVCQLWMRSKAQDAQSFSARTKLRAVRMLVLVVLAYLLTDGPWTVAFLVYVYKPSDVLPVKKHYIVISIVATLFYASSVLSPLVSAIHSATVQQEIVRILCCRHANESSDAKSGSLASKASTAKPYSSISYAREKLKDWKKIDEAPSEA
ncbi:pyroglutamylated RF-amide peptide receptor isoform X1 [Nematostella vectensis]|uniref:pyroglutamylated RF-amide peptide receptor isoform X1 n=2 Tax=Nematostella vectensis TaxID=45351 RepID=UPI0020777E7C|nr:pyroglutamylated RF-amide peptide receptor isoform X1 [Nematostella vectensis]